MAALPAHGAKLKTEIGVRELHDQLSRYVRHAAEGGEVVVTMRGQRVARLSPLEVSDPLANLRARGLVQDPVPPKRKAGRRKRLVAAAPVSDLVTRMLRAAVTTIDELCRELDVIGLDDALVRTAGELAERHALRGYDAVHLASATAIDDPDLVIATWDRELASAAIAEHQTASQHSSSGRSHHQTARRDRDMVLRAATFHVVPFSLTLLLAASRSRASKLGLRRCFPSPSPLHHALADAPEAEPLVERVRVRGVEEEGNVVMVDGLAHELHAEAARAPPAARRHPRGRTE